MMDDGHAKNVVLGGIWSNTRVTRSTVERECETAKHARGNMR